MDINGAPQMFLKETVKFDHCCSFTTRTPKSCFVEETEVLIKLILQKGGN